MATLLRLQRVILTQNYVVVRIPLVYFLLVKKKKTNKMLKNLQKNWYQKLNFYFLKRKAVRVLAVE